MKSQIEKLRLKLSVEQLKAAEMIAVNNFLPRKADEHGNKRLTYEEIADAVGITTRQLYNWRNYNDDFINFTNALASNAMIGHLPEILEKHLDMTLKGQGSMKGIELFYKFAGLLVDKSEVKADVNDNTNESIEERIAKLRERQSEGIGERGKDEE